MLITIGILMVLGVFAKAHRDRVSAPPAVAERRGAEGDGELISRAGLEGPGETYINPLDPVPKAEWEILTGCEVIKNPTNAAHHFRVRRSADHEKPIVFQLYFVEAPDLNDPGEDEVSNQARAFGWPVNWSVEESADRCAALGEQAWQEVEKLLERPFMVLTKFELRRETHLYYALVLFEDESGRRRTLQEWLVEHGYATITRPALGWLPVQLSADQFIERLEALQHEAQRERRGGWGVAQGAR